MTQDNIVNVIINDKIHTFDLNDPIQRIDWQWINRAATISIEETNQDKLNSKINKLSRKIKKLSKVPNKKNRLNKLKHKLTKLRDSVDKYLFYIYDI